MTFVWHLQTTHGTWLYVDPSTGILCHEQVSAVGVAVEVYTASVGASWLMLTALDDFQINGEALSATAFSYECVYINSGVALRHPSTKLYLTAVPDGRIDVGRPTIGGWETFNLVPVNTPSLDRVFFPLIQGELHTAEVVSYALHETSAPDTLAALLRLLPLAQVREAAAKISHLPVYKHVFTAIRMHLSAQEGQYEWTTGLHLSEGVGRYGWKIGAHSYGAPEIIDGQHGPLSIGSYCSIAGNVQIILANHALQTATTYPFSSLSAFWPSAENAERDHDGKGVLIGNNVWIGVGSCLLPGARIGDGAVIGARSVVSGTVAPFSVVAGSPARLIRQRFDDLTIERLCRLRWWDWPDYLVDRFIPMMLSSDIASFLDAAEAADATHLNAGEAMKPSA